MSERPWMKSCPPLFPALAAVVVLAFPAAGLCRFLPEPAIIFAAKVSWIGDAAKIIVYALIALAIFAALIIISIVGDVAAFLSNLTSMFSAISGAETRLRTYLEKDASNSSSSPGRPGAREETRTLKSGIGPSPEPEEQGLDAQLSALRRMDPRFSSRQFLDMASSAFIKLNEAVRKKELTEIPQFVTPTLFERFAHQVEELVRKGWTREIEQLKVMGADIAEALHDGPFFFLTVKISASARDYTMEIQTGKIISGKKSPRSFTEYWTFMRSDRVKTSPGPARIFSQHCPNCGASIKLNAQGRCEYCDSYVTSGEFDWVLCEICEASAWELHEVKQAGRTALSGRRHVIGGLPCPRCGAWVDDILGETSERCPRCGATVPTDF